MRRIVLAPCMAQTVPVYPALPTCSHHSPLPSTAETFFTSPQSSTDAMGASFTPTMLMLRTLHQHPRARLQAFFDRHQPVYRTTTPSKQNTSSPPPCDNTRRETVSSKQGDPGQARARRVADRYRKSLSTQRDPRQPPLPKSEYLCQFCLVRRLRLYTLPSGPVPGTKAFATESGT